MIQKGQGYTDGYIDGFASQKETIESQKQIIRELCGALQYWLSDSFSSDREFNRKMANEDLTILEKAKNLINE